MNVKLGKISMFLCILFFQLQITCHLNFKQPSEVKPSRGVERRDEQLAMGYNESPARSQLSAVGLLLIGGGPSAIRKAL